MSSTKATLDTVLYESKPWPRFTAAYVGRDVGMEVELEGSVFHLNEMVDTPYWTTKNDGSLKNGFEYVFSEPLAIGKLDAALDDFAKGIAKMAPATSIRTSVHVHVNVLGQTLREIYQSAFFYYLIEELVIRTQPRERIGNLFCLRMSDAATIPFYLDVALQGRHFSTFHEDGHKYSALNLCTVTRLGTLEFRLFQATWKKAELRKIARLCLDIVRRGAKHSLREMLDMYDEMPVKKFLAKMLPAQEWLWEGKTSEYLNELLHTNYDRLRDLVIPMEKPETMVMPKPLWLDDHEEVSQQQLQYFAEIEQDQQDAFIDHDDEPDDWDGGPTEAELAALGIGPGEVDVVVVGGGGTIQGAQTTMAAFDDVSPVAQPTPVPTPIPAPWTPYEED